MMINFHDLYQTYAPGVHRFCLWLCGDPHLADDLTAETFLRAWTNLRPDEPHTIKAYLLTIARNLYLHELRKNRRLDALDPAGADQDPGPPEIAEQRARLDAVIDAMRSLPEDERTALLLRTQAEMPYEEIAQVLGSTSAAVRVKVHRARFKIQAQLSKEGLA